MKDRRKYRVWNKTAEQYLENYVLLPNGDLIEQIGGEDVIVDEPEIEFCTGLKDSKGKLIFQKDIVKITDKSSRKEPFIGVVEYTKTASFEANCNGFYMYLHNPKTEENVSMVEKMFCTSLREIEVIGNIHNNPELLEK